MNRSVSGGADLHLHTIFSDGGWTPEEMVAAARAKGLVAIAVTDHDTLDGFQRAREAAGESGPEVIAGVEFSCPSRNGGVEEAHIVGLFLDTQCKELQEALAGFRRCRRKRAGRIVEKLNRLGVRLTPDEVFDPAGVGNVGRLHVARALVRAGHVNTVEAAFGNWIRVGRPAYVPRERPPAKETIALIHRAAGVAVLAHPGLTDLDEDISALAEQGLDAIEVYCSEHSSEQERHYLQIARHNGLLISGGSDCHGHNKVRNTLGNVRLDMAALEALRDRRPRAE